MVGEGRAAVLEADARDFLAGQKVAHLATADAAGIPNCGPVCFALAGDSVYMTIDRKPKSGRPLKRLRNIAENPNVTLTADYYDDEDWSRLRWVMVRGPGGDSGGRRRARRGAGAAARQVPAVSRDGPRAAPRDRDQNPEGHELECRSTGAGTGGASE